MSGRAYEMPFGRITMVPAIDFKDARYTLVNFNADGKAIHAVGGKNAVGVIQEPNNINEPAQVTTHGISFVILGATAKAGDNLSVGTDGKAIPVDADTAVVGICVVGGEAGDIGSILLK